MVVVLALLGMLLLVGFMFYTFANQEATNAGYFLDAAKSAVSGTTGGSGGGPGGASGLGAEFEIALRQIIIGPDTNETNSALWGGRKSLLATMYGRDIYPYTGRGVTLITDGLGNFFVDQDNDGVADAANQFLLDWNDSPAAWGQVPAGFNNYPSPDVDHTYADHNNPFLAYHGFALSINGAPVRTVIPSFHRPAFLRLSDTQADGEVRGMRLVDVDGDGKFDPNIDRDITGYWTSLTAARRSLRPHPLHQDVDTNGAPLGFRFIRDDAEATALNATGPFPFTPDYYNERLPNGSFFEQGVWSLSPWRPNSEYREGEWVVARRLPPLGGPPDNTRLNGVFYRCMTNGTSSGTEPTTWGLPGSGPIADGSTQWEPYYTMTTNYEYDADPDGDGIREAVWLDLDAPIIDLGGGKKAIRLYAITIHDADGLLNLNAHGNVEGRVNLVESRDPNATVPFGTDIGPDGQPAILPLSRSNLGLTPSEVSPLYGLNAGLGANNDLASVDANNDVFEQLRLYFGPPGATAATWSFTPLELANMEWWLLSAGKLQFEGSVNPGSLRNYLPGRYGEMDGFVQGFFANGQLPMSRYQHPNPGITGQYDAVPGTNPPSGNQTYSTGLDGQPRFAHPLDFRGMGRMTQMMATGSPFQGRLPQLFNTFSATGNTMSWVQYLDFSYPTNQPPGAQPPGWITYLGGNLAGYTSPGDPELRGRTDNPLQDEAYELDLESALANVSDARFSLADGVALQLSGADIDNLSYSSRLFTLAEYNFRRNVRSSDMRRRFTTHSRDMKTFGTTYDENYPVPRQLFEWAQDPNNNGLWTFPRPWPAGVQADPIRTPLRSLLTVVANQTQSPQVTGPGAAVGVLRAQQQRRLSINHVVDFARNPANGQLLGNAGQVFLEARSLTAHPVNPGLGPVPTVTTTPPYTPGAAPDSVPYTPTAWSAAQQEAWARRDRQMLARDIYTMLYLYGGGADRPNPGNPNDGYDTIPNTLIDPATGQRALHDESQLRDMAQFAINLVNALDRDNVIDRFEYPKDLATTGWNFDPLLGQPFLDDNPYTIEGTPYTPTNPGYDANFPNDSATRGEVDGVEAQQLTFSEAMAIRSVQYQENMSPQNLEVTEFNDDEDRYFTFIELRNASPDVVDLTATAAPNTTPWTGPWQIQVVRIWDDDANPMTPDVEVKLRELTFLNNPPPPGQPAPGAPIPGGGVFSILSTGDRSVSDTVTTTNEVSQFVVDLNFLTGMPPNFVNMRIAPRFYQMQHELDLINDSSTATSSSLFFRLEDESGGNITASGGLLDKGVGLLLGFTEGQSAGGNLPELTLRLRRRAHPLREVPGAATAAYEQDNPWVVVDETMITRDHGLSEFNMNGRSDSGQDAQDQLRLGPAKAWERAEPLARQTENLYPGNPPATIVPVANPDDWKMNTIGDSNQLSRNLPGASALWQVHFDRDFANEGELFAVPLYGPRRLTRDLAPDINQTPTLPIGWHTAGIRKFLQPLETVSPATPPRAYGLDGIPNTLDDEPKYTNRWHRLFELTEVPTPVNPPLTPDMSGQINWNTIRYPSVLAGLVDDRTAFAAFSPWIPATTPIFPLPGYMGDAAGEARDWWVEFIRARDRQDPVTATMLPGSPEATPLRGLNFAGEGVTSIDRTFLESLPKDADPASGLAAWQHRRMFELSAISPASNQHQQFLAGAQNGAGQSAVTADPYLKHRVLAKMLNNSTTRSNVFFVFIEVGLFEVADGPNGEERIGSKISGVEQPRAVFVIDRTRAHGQLDSPNFAANNAGDPAVFRFLNGDGVNNFFDWKSLVIHSQRIE